MLTELRCQYLLRIGRWDRRYFICIQNTGFHKADAAVITHISVVKQSIIKHKYDRVNVEKAKKQNKTALQKEMGLNEDEKPHGSNRLGIKNKSHAA